MGNGVMITRDDFLAALAEYGAIVRAEDVKMCLRKSHRSDDMGAIIATVVNNTKLP